jgi:sulfite exporter TauE/SafE/plastocyanin domain-containing protein/copper chaperone CopZ
MKVKYGTYGGNFMNLKKERIGVFEMTCTSCEARVEKAVRELDGVSKAKASYSGQYVDVEYEAPLCSTESIKSAIKAAGYSTKKSSNSYGILGIALVAIIIYLLSNNTQGFDMNERLKNASYFVLFIVGLLTSIHCVGMCGGIMLSQSVNKNSESSKSISGRLEAIRPALLYNIGRLISYTLLGGLVGALGSAISLSLSFQAGLQIFAAAFMIIMGLNMFGFKAFRKLHIKLPWSACSVNKKSKAPLVVGLLNGFMPCGPLQTMQLYALGTGSAYRGALSMFFFALGTIPLMLGFGAISGLLSKGYTKQLLKYSGVFIIILGLIMGRRGLALAGVNVPDIASIITQNRAVFGGTIPEGAKAVIEDGVQVIRMTADGRGYTPNGLYVQKDLPIRWIVEGNQINSCNNEIIVPSLKIRQKLERGETIIEIPPQSTGDISFSCWMGMIRGVIKVVDDLDAVDTSISDPSIPPAGAGGGCCGGGGASYGPSIYGDNWSEVASDVFVKKAVLSEGIQTIDAKAIGYEFDPLIIVVEKDIPVRINIDANEFDYPSGSFEVIDGDTGEIIIEAELLNNITVIEFTYDTPGIYGILKDGTVLSIIEVVEDIGNADINLIRYKYLD